MEEAAELGNYLPLSFKSPKEQEYIEFLWDAFEAQITGVWSRTDTWWWRKAPVCAGLGM